MAGTLERTAAQGTAPQFDWRGWIHAGIAMVLLSAVLLVLERQLAELRWQDVANHLRSIPREAVLSACAFTILSYSLLCAFDILALRYIGRHVAFRKIFYTSFLAYAISHNLGAGALTGGAVRYKLYSGVGLGGVEIATVQGFCSLTTVLGLMVLIGSALIAAPRHAAAALHLRMPWPSILGGMTLALVAGYMAWGHFGRRSHQFRSWELRPPGEMIAVMQVLVGIVEMGVKAAVLWCLVPGQEDLTFVAFLGAYGLAVIAGMVSYVPGGLGVFESVIAFSLPRLRMYELLGALVAYRVIYYFVPLAIAGLAIVLREFKNRHQPA
jgi:phosphatidylglycerol lysyltransferase